MADEHELMIETEIPINFTKSTSEAMEQGACERFTDGMVATVPTGDGDIPAGVVHTEVTAAEASDSVSIYRRGFFRATAGVGGVTFGKAIRLDSSTSPTNRLVDSGANENNNWGVCLETAGSGVRFAYELNPTIINAS